MLAVLAVLLALAALTAACWWGANVVFHPPELLPEVLQPEELGLRADRFHCVTGDGVTLRGWTIPAAKPTDRSIVFCHGWGDNKGDVLRRFAFLQDAFNLVFFDTRAHGESDGEHSTIGYLESRDFAAVAAWLRENRPSWTRRLGVCGLSMGAAVAIEGMSSHPEFRCAFLESPFRSFNTVVGQFCWNKFRLPFFPFAWWTLLVIRFRLGGDPEGHSPAYHAAKLSPRPLLFVTGAQDALMPVDEVRRLFAEAGEPKELWVIPEASHGRCQEFAGGEYERRALEFFEKHL